MAQWTDGPHRDSARRWRGTRLARNDDACDTSIATLAEVEHVMHAGTARIVR
jgi:hypothetical protein